MERGQFGTFAFFPYSRRWRRAKRTQRVVARLRVSRRSERCAIPRHSSRFRNIGIEVPREGCRPSLSREQELRKECEGALSHPRAPQCRRKGERSQYAEPSSPMSCTNMLVAPLSVCEGERVAAAPRVASGVWHRSSPTKPDPLPLIRASAPREGRSRPR